MKLAILACAIAACDFGGGSNAPSGPRSAESGTRRGSAGGFSAAVGAELMRSGEPIELAPLGAAGPAPAGSAASASQGRAASGSASAAGASGSPASGAAGSASGSPASGAAGSASDSPGDRSTGSGGGATGSSGGASASSGGSAGVASSGVGAASGANASGAPAAGSASGASGSPSGASGAPAAGSAAPPAEPAPSSRKKVPAGELAAIKLELEPNWERDVGEAGTFSLAVKIPGTEDTRVFSARYGFEDPEAPVDCDQYRKFLEDKRVMRVRVNRQRGAACYLEGEDKGRAVYRMLLTYGGKRLVCSGSLYKEGASATLGDLRDKVLMQAKKICETLTL